VYLFHNVTNFLKTSEFAPCFLIDFSKAFNSVSRSILLDKLAAFDCLPVVKSWLANLLTDRTQSVLSVSEKSGSKFIIQGSDIGPTAFHAMITDLQPVNKTTKLSKIADDLTVVIQGSLVVD
jgi:Reverse transcriptase (RNA-dependent DNA polymerase)